MLKIDNYRLKNSYSLPALSIYDFIQWRLGQNKTRSIYISHFAGYIIEYHLDIQSHLDINIPYKTLNMVP